MKKINYYKETGVPYPRKEDFVFFQVNNVKNGSVIHSHLTESELKEKGFSTVGRIQEVAIQEVDGVKYTVIYHRDDEAYNVLEKKYHLRQNELMAEFQRDLAISEGLEPGSKLAKLIYIEAWDRGHSAGLDEVASYYNSTADFVNEVAQALSEK